MRLPYAPSTPSDPSPETAQIYTSIAARRNPRPITKLDRALLHSPPVANGWNELLGAIRTKSTLSQAVMELSICRIAVLNNAVYEWTAHAPLALKAGVARQVLETVRTVEVFGASGAIEELERRVKEGGKGLSREQWIVIAYTDQMTRHVTVEEGLFEAVRGLFEQRQVVELTATVASYNCVSRFLVALDVCEMNGESIQMPPES